MIELVTENQSNARIVVVGVGGGGGNAVSTMIRSELAGVDFISANTDSQALANSLAPSKIQLGGTLTFDSTDGACVTLLFRCSTIPGYGEVCS